MRRGSSEASKAKVAGTVDRQARARISDGEGSLNLLLPLRGVTACGSGHDRGGGRPV